MELSVTGAAVVLMLTYVNYAIGEIQVFPGEPFNCSRYIDYVMKEWSCRPDGLFKISDDVMNDGIFTRDELFEEVDKRCSNETLVEKYFDCLEDLKDECPLQSILVLRAVQEKMAMFCDGTRVSAWLLMTIRDGYTYSNECASVVKVLLAACAEKVSISYQNFGPNATLTTALDVLPRAVSDMFQCTKNKFSEIPASYLDCGSSWQDMFLTVWLQMSASMGVGAYLSSDQRLQLIDLKNDQIVKRQTTTR